MSFTSDQAENLLGSATEVAPTEIPIVTRSGLLGTVMGAVYFPFASIVPQSVGVQTVSPELPMCHVTPLFAGSF